MEFWDDLSKKLSDAADYTVRETGKLTEVAKLKYRLSVLRGKENDLFRTLGKIKYGECIGNETDTSACDGIVGQISELRREAEEISARLAALRNYKFCIACHEKMAASMAFCPYCGTKQGSGTAKRRRKDEREKTGMLLFELLDISYSGRNELAAKDCKRYLSYRGREIASLR